MGIGMVLKNFLPNLPRSENLITMVGIEFVTLYLIFREL